jgi:molybdopterin-guanine dinucleotide biosynthesis protein A
MTRPTLITGTLLAGGLSRRMFESAGRSGDKGLLSLGSDSMIAHVIARVRPQVSALVLNANGDPGRFAALGLPVVADPIEGFVGPLAGVLAGLRWTAAHHPQASHTLTVSSDAPFLPADLASRFSAALVGASGAIAIAQSEDGLHPVIGLWPVALADDLEAALHGGVRKVLAWTDQHGTVPVPFANIAVRGVTVDPFFNANTPAELEEARRLLKLMS